jgi:UDP-GlcNAc:undecaprenyl-phosphate/decaprenyl-phosphate GlcNAc-1-phosphate transferase
MYSLLFLLIISFALSLVLTPLVRTALRRVNIVDVPDGSRRLHSKPVARGGGAAVVLSFALSYVLLMILPFGGKVVVASGLQFALHLMPAVLVMFATGIVDDIRGLKPWQKLLGQALAAALAYQADVRVTGIGGHHIPAAAALPITMCWLIGCANAINLLDGIDGLACGIGLFASIATVLAAALDHNVALAMAAVPLAGCLGAFLIFNFYPASIFLGDSGSLFIGFLLGCYGVIWTQKSTTIIGMTAPLMLLAIPLMDTTLSILRRYVRHKPIMAGDRGHIHHRLLEKGFSMRGAVLIIYACFSFAAMLSLLQSVVHKQYGGLVVVAFCLFFSLLIWVGLDRLGYIEIRLASRLLYEGAFSRRMLHTYLSLWDLERSLVSAHSLDACWSAICDAARGLGFCPVCMNVDGIRYVPDDDSPAPRDCWDLSIPLSGSDSIQLGLPFDARTHEFVMSIFVRVLRDSMRQKINELLQVQSSEGDPVGSSPATTSSATI